MEQSEVKYPVAVITSTILLILRMIYVLKFNTLFDVGFLTIISNGIDILLSAFLVTILIQKDKKIVKLVGLAWLISSINFLRIMYLGNSLSTMFVCIMVLSILNIVLICLWYRKYFDFEKPKQHSSMMSLAITFQAIFSFLWIGYIIISVVLWFLIEMLRGIPQG